MKRLDSDRWCYAAVKVFGSHFGWGAIAKKPFLGFLFPADTRDVLKFRKGLFRDVEKNRL